VAELCHKYLRSDVLLPMHPVTGASGAVWTAVDEAVVLPSCHCAFRDCTFSECGSGAVPRNSHEEGLWNHIWRASGHQKILRQLIQQYRLQDSFSELQETAFALYNQGLLEQERLTCPLLGVATDRRCLSHLREVFHEENAEVLMCFICGCKHICHTGFDKFGRPFPKGTIAYRHSSGSVLREILDSASHEDSRKYD